MKLQQKGKALLLAVKVMPNSSRTRLAGVLGDALKIRVGQPPEDGRANRAVEELLAQTLHLPGSQVKIVAGHARAQKAVEITGIPLEAARKLLAQGPRE